MTQFTSRYGSGPGPSWLRFCRGQCEGMGWYPVKAQVDITARDPLSATLRADGGSPLTADESAQIARRIAAGQVEDDGWYFLRCPACHGTGRVSWRQSALRVPSWLWRGVRWCWSCGPSSTMWGGHPAPWRQRAWVTFKIAFLCDLGWRI